MAGTGRLGRQSWSRTMGIRNRPRPIQGCWVAWSCGSSLRAGDSRPGDRAALAAADELANRLLNSYRAVHSTSWNWFEYGLAYSNARLPQALIRAGMRGGNDEMISAGLEALDWLGTIQLCEIKGHFVPIGSHGFYSRKTEKARFDQQPVEACAVVSA